MRPYQYSDLSSESQEIRIFTIFPGEFDDAITATIDHAPLLLPDLQPAPRSCWQDVQESLPSPWTVQETIEGYFLFSKPEEHGPGYISSWKHPDPEVNPATYEGAARYPDVQPTFEALSYTWGIQNEQETIRIENSILAPQARNQAPQDKTRTLWVDAICINQSNNEEKNVQVVRMADTYRLAYRVIVWLGVEGDGSDLALSTLNYLGQQVELLAGHSLGPSPDCVERYWADPYVELPYTSEQWISIQTLIERPWFQRIWIRQEVQLANERSLLLCGRGTISWRHFRRAIVCLAMNMALPSLGFDEAISPLAVLVGELRGHPLLSILQVSRSCKRSDSRDKIYGMLGVAPTNWARSIRPQYSLSVSDVYKEAFLAYIGCFRRLDFLHLCDLKHQKLEGPSWSQICPGPKTITFNRIGQFNSGISSSEGTYLSENVLIVLGVESIILRDVSELCPKDQQSALQFVRRCVPENLTTGTYVTSETMLDAFVSTFTLNHCKDRMPVEPSTQAKLKESFIQITLEDSSDIDADNVRIILQESRTIQNRVYFKTEEGHIGLGPAGAKPGDQVSVLLGCHSPIVLRPASLGRFQVIGDCYVHGLSDAVSILGPLPDPWTVQIRRDPYSFNTQYFLDGSTGVLTGEDSRLEPLGLDWERMEVDRVRDDPGVFAKFKNKTTGQIMNSDPRLLPEALKDRWVDLKTFYLV